MIRRLSLAALLLAAPAAAADKNIAVGSFERVRVEGPFLVRIQAGRSPAVRASGDSRLLERLDVDTNGTTLVLRYAAASEGWESGRSDGGGVPTITLTTPRVLAIAITAGGRVSADRVTGQRVDLSLTGSGSLDVAAADAEQLVAVLVGNGRLSVGGRVSSARLSSNGSGTIDAARLSAGTLTVRQDGTGEISAAARFTAQINSSGLGSVDIAGNPKCTVAAAPAGPVRCGSGVRAAPAR